MPENMISKDTFDFLKKLNINNNKEWFDENRILYTIIRKEFETFIELVINELSKFDKDSSQTTAKASIFRINRDIRFSADKLPYKTNLGAFIAKGGRKGINAGYYIHVEPGGCFLAGGIYMPSGPMLKAIRSDIYDYIDEFREIINASSFQKHFGKTLWGEKLKSAPKGFNKEFPHIELLKYKHYTIMKDEPDRIYCQPHFIDEVKEVFQAMAPFNKFLNRAVSEVER
jgi:uncharacterized protein (TIGR02453 family)